MRSHRVCCAAVISWAGRRASNAEARSAISEPSLASGTCSRAFSINVQNCSLFMTASMPLRTDIGSRNGA